MIAIAWWQSILGALGAIIAFIYRYIPNYGVTVIVLTVAIRVLLAPLAIKQIRSMQAMQAIQPKMKALQQKYKGNRQKLNEETMALYKEHGVNPFGGCLPLLMQFPVLIALFAVLRVPSGLTHIPQDSHLAHDIKVQAPGVRFLGANLLCSAGQAGRTVTLTRTTNPKEQIEGGKLNCGHGVPVRIPYYLFAAAMIATTYYQQRQMQRASPPGAASQQQQMLTKFMPLLFGFWGFLFPSGLVVYWTTTNLIQIGQQYFMLPGLRGPSSSAEDAATPSGGSGERGGQGKAGGAGKRSAGSPKASGRAKPAGGKGSRDGQPRKGGRWVDGLDTRSGRRSGRSGGSQRSGRSGRPEGQSPEKGGSSGGGRDAGDRKKRRKR